MIASRLSVSLGLALVVGGCGDGRSLPGETPTAADSAISGGLRGPGLGGELNLCTADGMAPVAARQAGAFMRRYPNARITVSAATARECVAAVADGSAGAALVDRSLNEEEREVMRVNGIPVSEVLMGTGAVAAIVASENRVVSLNMDALRRLVSGDAVTWAELADSVRGTSPAGAARLALAPRNAGAVELLASRMLPAGALPRPTDPADSEEAVLDWAARTPDGLGMISLAVLRADTTARVRAVALPDSTGAPTLPDQRAIADRRYPLRQPLVLLVVGGHGPLAAAFATFARGNPGQEAVLRAGLLPAVRPVREIVLD